MNDLWFALLFFLPAGVANASPVFANRIPLLNRWNTPLDFGKSFGSQRLLGDNKRIRGIVFGSLAGGLTGGLVYQLQPEIIQQIKVVSMSPLMDMIFLGIVLGFGALLGDAVESFFKRRVGIKPGRSWFPFDQTDYIIGGLIVVSPFVDLDLALIGRVFVIYFGLHLITSYAAYLLHLKDHPI